MDILEIKRNRYLATIEERKLSLDWLLSLPEDTPVEKDILIGLALKEWSHKSKLEFIEQFKDTIDISSDLYGDLLLLFILEATPVLDILPYLA